MFFFSVPAFLLLAIFIYSYVNFLKVLLSVDCGEEKTDF